METQRKYSIKTSQNPTNTIHFFVTIFWANLHRDYNHQRVSYLNVDKIEAQVPSYNLLLLFIHMNICFHN